MGQADWKNLSVHLDLVAEERGSPVDVLCSQYNWLLEDSVLKDGHVNWLVQLEEHCRVKFDLFVVSDELKHESLIPDWVAGSLHDLGAEAIFEETNRHRHLLVRSDIDEVNEGVSAHN